jgi:hypothetical protein
MKETLAKYYSQLEGATITKFNGFLSNELGGSDFPSFDVVLKDGSTTTIEISQDEEGNGGGFLFGLSWIN